MRLLRLLLLASCLLVAAAPALAFVAQTITVDGTNDFDPSNLVRDDRHDTQKFFCSPDSVYPLDLGRVYVTNDNNYVYFGFDWSLYCFDKPNIGIAIDVNGAAGGTSDPFGRKIGWTNVTNKPDFVVYDVPSWPANTYHYQVLYKWTGAAWADSTRLVNGSPAGPNALGMIDNTGFVELRLPLAALGVSAGQHVNLEWWFTQDETQKGPLDAVMSSDVQTSTPASTVWNPPAIVQMTSMYDYTVLSATDAVPPTVSQALAVQFPLAGDKQFGLTTNKVDVVFSEPVDATSANNTANYAYSGPVTRFVVGASRDAGATNVVHLLLNSTVSANAAFHNLTVTGVKDLANNTIVADGIGNVGSFFIQNLVFQSDASVELCKGIFAPTDTFSVEGSLAPLTFETLCENARAYDPDADSVYATTVPFAMPKSATTGTAEADLEYKFVHQCADYEGGGNRTYHLSSDNGASVTLATFWNNDDPANFTTHPIAVVFRVDATRISPTPADTLYVQGNEFPLSFTPSGLAMRDDGVDPDAVAGDRIYSARATFPACTRKSLEWKIFYRGAFECLGQGNRTVALDDGFVEMITHARGIERCTVTDKAVTVIFPLTGALHPFGSPDTIAVMGGVAPLSFAPPPATLAWMNDLHLGYDVVAGDKVWTAGVTFPDSSNLAVSYKFWHNGTFECLGYPDRFVMLDDVSYSVAAPQWRPLAIWDYCSDNVTGVPEPVAGPDAIAGFALLRQSFPNPMSPSTTIRFDLKRAGAVALSVYDIGGRRVARLWDGALPAGPHEMRWNGRDEAGQLVRAGVYVYELAMGRERLSRRMVITR